MPSAHPKGVKREISEEAGQRMAPQKAAKKAAKKVAKKAAKHTPEHQAEKRQKDTRRAYEHLGRVQVLTPLLAAVTSEKVHTLANLAQSAFRAGSERNAADLLRAAEHLCFGSLASTFPADAAVTPALKEAIKSEYEHLSERAADQAGEHQMPKAIAAIYKEMLATASKAMRSGSFRTALEMARGAEALAHVEGPIAALSAGEAPSALLR
jgi:hypothetical protein